MKHLWDELKKYRKGRPKKHFSYKVSGQTMGGGRANEIASLTGQGLELISNILQSCKKKDKKEEPKRIPICILPHTHTAKEKKNKNKNNHHHPMEADSMCTVCP